MGLEDLRHVTRRLKSGGQVVVLDTGAEIPPDAEAMLQALHSRSVGGLFHHLGILAKSGAKKFMETFYVGYGHKSIGDCGSATVFVEGVSMLVPKAIQDWPLYNGQESSTRYIDFANQPFVSPLGAKGNEIHERWRAFYLRGLDVLKRDLPNRYPRSEHEDEKTYAKAINARAFDIMRGFLPAGAATNLAWHMTLRQFGDELLWLRHHPLEEVREVAETTEDALIEMFPSSFSKKRYVETEQYVAEASLDHTYYPNLLCPDFNVTREDIDRRLLKEYQTALATRPPKAELPRKIRECGNLRFEFLLDFASFRDIQRQRAVVQQMPLLTTYYGFHPWYLNELTLELREEAGTLLATQQRAIKRLGAEREIAQYYTAMGFQIANRVTGDLHALAYLAELRSSQTVHPTLRVRAIQIGNELQKRFAPDGLILHMDTSPTRFDIRRGTHDITLK